MPFCSVIFQMQNLFTDLINPVLKLLFYTTEQKNQDTLSLMRMCKIRVRLKFKRKGWKALVYAASRSFFYHLWSHSCLNEKKRELQRARGVKNWKVLLIRLPYQEPSAARCTHCCVKLLLLYVSVKALCVDMRGYVRVFYSCPSPTGDWLTVASNLKLTKINKSSPGASHTHTQNMHTHGNRWFHVERTAAKQTLNLL